MNLRSTSVIRIGGMIPFVFLAILACAGALADDPYEGGTLISPMNSSYSYMMDLDGTTTMTWHGADKPGYVAYWFPDGSILRPCYTFNSYFHGGATGGRFQKIDASDTVVWDFTYSSSEYLQHHDIEPLPNGNFLAVCWERYTRTEAQAMGRTSITGEMWPTLIVEIEPSGSSGGTVVWEWRLWDHLIQDADPSKPNYGVVADHPELLDINVGSIHNGDWDHVNAVDYNADLDQIVISSHTLHEFYIIDHSTTTAEAAGHTGGNCGKGGDLLYRWGNPQNYDRGSSSDKHFYVIHGVNWIEEGLPGAGNILILNNGDRSGSSNDYSSAEEFVTPLLPDGNYDITTGQPYGPTGPVWSYSDPSTFYAAHLGGAYRMPNGNTLITEGTNAYMFEVSSAGDFLWDHDISGELGRVNRYSLGATATPTPSPTATPVIPTNTPGPTSTPTMTPTLPAGTPTWTPEPTTTPTMNPDVGMTLVLEDDLLTLGDRFYLHMTLGPMELPTTLDAYVLLEVDGLYWCWPGWLSLDQGLDYRTYSLSAGQTVAEDLLDFAWPQVDGFLTGLYFYGAAFGADSFDLLGEVQVLEFGYR